MFRNTKGQGASEYAMIIVVAVIAVVIALTILRPLFEFKNLI
jgi:type II secretory pathway component PulF